MTYDKNQQTELPFSATLEDERFVSALKLKMSIHEDLAVFYASIGYHSQHYFHFVMFSRYQSEWLRWRSELRLL